MNRIHASHADSAMCYCLRIWSYDILNPAYLGDFLKELQLMEGRSTGFPKIYQAMKANGSPEPTFETDVSFPES